MLRLALLLALFATPAFAQQQNAQDAIRFQIGDCIINNLILRDQVTVLTAKITELERQKAESEKGKPK